MKIFNRKKKNENITFLIHFNFLTICTGNFEFVEISDDVEISANVEISLEKLYLMSHNVLELSNNV